MQGLPALEHRASRVRWLRPQDIVWLLLFSALAFVSPHPTPQEIVLLMALAILQVLEPRIPQFATERGLISAILFKLGLCYLLIGWTGAISSSYYVLLLLPVVSAATTLNLAGTFAVTVFTCLSYLSFVLYIDWSKYEFTPDAVGELGLRIIFLPVVAFLTYELAEGNRVEARRAQAVALELEQANRNLREAEAAVRRADRLAALGQLTAGLAHELRNPLGTIRASAELLVKSVQSDNEVASEMAGFISSEVDRTNSLITRFLEFARPVKLRLEEVDLSAVIDAAVEELHRRYPPYPVSVYKNYSLEIPRAAIDAELFQRAIYNLLSNAAQATPEGGTVTIKTRAFDDTAEIAVIDRGAGIERQNLESIFNPFFTTKADGVGLGLAIVSKIIDEHGGRIAVESKPGEGSIFRVLLPVRKAVPPLSQQA